MKIVRFSDGDSPRYGALEDGSTRIVVLKGDPLFNPVEPDGRIAELDEVRLLSPVIPRSKVVAIGKNYADHAREMNCPPEVGLIYSVFLPGDLYASEIYVDL